MEEKSEYDCEIIEACNRELKRDSFDDKLRRQAYKAMQQTKRAGKERQCNFCMCKDATKGECIIDKQQRVEQKRCWKAINTLKLKEKKMYGQKTNTQERAY